MRFVGVICYVTKLKIPVGLALIEFHFIRTWVSDLTARDKLFMLNLLLHEGVGTEYSLSVKESSLWFAFPKSMV